MRNMTAKLQDGYRKTMQCMWILNINDAWKKKLGQTLRNWKFFSCDRSRIDQTSIDRKIGSIDRKSGKIRFLKNKTSFGKNSFGETLGGGENKDTQTKLKN